MKRGCRHSSVNSSAPSILPPQVWLPSMPSLLFSFIVKFVHAMWEKNENKQKKRPGLAHLKKFHFMKKKSLNRGCQLFKILSNPCVLYYSKNIYWANYSIIWPKNVSLNDSWMKEVSVAMINRFSQSVRNEKKNTFQVAQVRDHFHKKLDCFHVKNDLSYVYLVWWGRYAITVFTLTAEFPGHHIWVARGDRYVYEHNVGT